MKKYIYIILVFFILLWGVPVNSTVLWSEDFDGFPDWRCPPTSTHSTMETSCTAPVKTGQTVSPFSSCISDTYDWDGATPTYIHGIYSTAGRTGKGWRLHLRGYTATPNYENIMKGRDIGVDVNPIYLRWYARESHLDFKNSSYQKLFRMYPVSGPQIMIPQWIGSTDGLHTYFRLWFSNGSTIYWTNYDLATSGTANTWVCYELKFDIANNKYQFWINDTNMGEKSASTNIATSNRVRYITIGGNQHSANCWTPATDYKTRDYDDIVLSDSKIGCSGTPPPTYSVGGTVSGLNGTVVLQNNLSDDTNIVANGSYTFSTQLSNGSNYSVTIKTQPTGQTCTVTNGTGTINGANVTNANISCTTNPTYYTIGGVVSGLSGTVVLQNNGGDNKSVYADGSFTFPTTVLNGATYLATVYGNPTGQTCTVTNGSGSVSGANVTNILVTCTNTATGGNMTISTSEGSNTLTLGTGSNTLTWGEVPVVPETIVKLTYFPSVDQDNMYTNTGYNYNCGVRASTEVMGYWANHGFTNLMTSLPTGAVPDDSTQMQTLFTNMVSYTTYSNYCDGSSGRGQYWYTNMYCYTTSNYPTSGSIVYLIDKLKSYLTLKGYNGSVTSEGTLPSFATIKSKIDSGIPVMLMLHECNHWVTVLGYNTTGGLENIYINIGHDNWSGCSGVYSTITGVYEDEIAYASIPTSVYDDAVYIHPTN
jgi:hypothetical protein